MKAVETIVNNGNWELDLNSAFSKYNLLLVAPACSLPLAYMPTNKECDRLTQVPAFTLGTA